MDLYNGKITEFIDWSGSSQTGNLPVSGGSIRELLQRRLKEPFVMKEDVANNRYRMFASEDAYAAWKEDPTDNWELELFSFARPSDYKLELSAIGTDGFSTRYIRYGDSNNSGARIAFSWNIFNDEGDSSDSLQATYTISNTSSGYSTTFTRWYNKADANPDFSIYDYLRPGENVITIACKGALTGARNTKQFIITLLQINIDSSFKFYDKFYADQPLQIPYVFVRNDTSGTAKIYFKIDEGGSGKDGIVDVVQNGPTKTVGIWIPQSQLEEGEHVIQIWAEAKYNDGNTTINSNLLYYTFTIASSAVGSVGKFINVFASFKDGNLPQDSLMLYATQYESFSMQWGYYTDSLQTNTSISVTWKLLDGLDDQNPTQLSVITANSQEKAPNLSFIPTTYTQDGHQTYIAAYFGESLIKIFPIYIAQNTKVVVTETGFYQLKMSAYGKTNESVEKDIWKDVTNTVSTTFNNISWNTNSGWYQNSFRTFGVNQSAIINFNPFQGFGFTTGKTIEIEFETEKVLDVTDKVVVIGNPSGARVEITPDTATLYDNSNNEVVHTNYKSNERLKLAFIINNIPENQILRTAESGLAYIINNGILERAASASGRSFDTEGTIKIGGASSGIRVYNIRVYNYSITYNQAYDNFLYDSENKAVLADRNNITDSSGNIAFDLCKNKIDTILISGDLSNILSGESDKDLSTTNVSIERFCPTDATKNFKINNAQIRKHGQSTLNYPVTSMKFWFNKSRDGNIPVYEITQQEDLLLNKNRYVTKSVTDGGKPSIPANKFVLQANYADSSGVHNGGLQRLIQNTWFNARINGEYKLRTEPQLFATNQLVHFNNQNLHEDGRIEGYSNVKNENIQWSDITSREFPYDIRIAPDSFPCAVFYYDESGTKTRTFLGQYVWMDDKKSDFCYGERSIYAVPSDPFCLTNTHKDDDTDANLVWDNKNVLRVEVVGSNVPFTSYMTHQGFTNIVEVEDETTHNVTRMYNWEQAFEMIYPDEDDIAEDDAKNGLTKFDSNSKYVRKIQPFIDFHEWVVSTRNNQSKFEAEAAQHLDLYKMAAYYVFVLRFGLVDSLERNAQIKTYDGVHWHYEPWDMDIALGNKNDGGIAFDPPIDRNTKLPGSVTTYAISGRSANQNGTIATSNWLWDALESWDYWVNTVVKDVADALYDDGHGLTYDNASKMFDEEYAEKWSEIMYNQSGFFKYVESGAGDPTWLSWLQGSRMSHRHWWLSNSMDYYDAKWFCGDYKNHFIYVRANVTEGSDQYVRIVPNKQTYISVTKDEVIQKTASTDHDHPFEFNMTVGSQTKNPILFYGANFMEEIDLSEIAHGLDGVTLNGAYSEVLGSPIKRLDVGVKIVENQDQNIDADYIATLASLGCQIQGVSRVFENLEYLNIRGQLNQKSLNSFIYNNDISSLKELRAMGSGIIDFYSSESGNAFTNIELPDTVYTIWMNNSTWQNLSFWHTTANDVNIADILADQDIEYGTDAYYDAIAEIAENNPELLENTAYIKEIDGVPSTVHNVSLLGTTGSTLSSIQFVKSWLHTLSTENVDLSQYNLIMDKINWQDATVGEENLLTYDELSLLAQLGSQTSLKGYLVLKNTGEDLTIGQLNHIKSWFGDAVFTKNSSGLVVDHERQYVQINFGGDVTIDELGNVTIVEGGRVSLNATRFSLAEDDDSGYVWAIGEADSNIGYGRLYGALWVIQPDSSGDGKAYLQTTQSQIGHDYDIKIYTSVNAVNYSTTIHVIAATYPSDLFIDAQTEGQYSPRIIPTAIQYWKSGISANLFVNSNQDYTATIRNITYTLTRQSDGVSVSYITGQDGANLSEFIDQYIVIQKSTSTSGLKITTDSIVPDDPQYYTITAESTFISGKVIEIQISLIVQDDQEAIVTSFQPNLFTPINNAWIEQFGTEIGRSSIYKLDLASIESISFNSVSNSIQNLVTQNGNCLFKYLINCKSVDMTGCYHIQNTEQSIIGDDKNQLDFSNMTKLEKLKMTSCSSITSITIPGTIKRISGGTYIDAARQGDFQSCTHLASVVIENGVERIENGGDYTSNQTGHYWGAFVPGTVGYITSRLQSVTIPESLTYIGNYTFYRGNSMSVNVYISNLQAWCNIVFGGRNYANPLYDGGRLYLNGTELSNITIPEGITAINKYAFHGCASLTSVVIPYYITRIGERAFYSCSNLTSVVIEYGVTHIESSAFCLCSNLTSIVIPASVTNIGTDILYKCSNLNSITFESITPPQVPVQSFTPGLFDNTTCPIYVPAESVEAYKTAYAWSQYADRIEAIPSNP